MSGPTTKPSCARCGEPITPGARFCMKCGSDISGEQGGVPTAMMPAAKDESDEMLELLRQATLGDYEIHRELGRGGMATVYLAHDIALDRKVALKVMSPALLLMGEGMAERFKREARTAASLSHPHIIPIYAVKSHGKTLFFVMKFIAGRSLESLIKDLGPMPVEMVRALLQQVGTALGYAHRHGIVHRDVKPANIMIDEEGWSVVTDFGIAKVAENRGLTMTGIAVGTPSYMSPEQCAAKDITGKSDQYSLGVVAYEMLTGKQPFEGDSAMAIMFAHFNEAPRPLTEHRPDIPLDMALAVMRMLEKSADRRWGSLEEALAAMDAEPLAHDDPVRLELVRVVRAKSNRVILDDITPPPTSPVPPAKPRPSAEAATTPIPTARPTQLSVTPATSDLVPGEQVQLHAALQATGGVQVTQTEAFVWSSSEPAVASVNNLGLVKALKPGWATITASCFKLTGEAEVVVEQVPVASITLDPATHDLTVGGIVTIRARVGDANGNELTDRTMVWAAAPGGIVSLTPLGEITALKTGKVEITVECEGIKGIARLTVTPPPVAAVAVTPAERSLTVGDTAAFSARLTDAAGKPLSDRPVTWTSLAPEIVAISPRGIVTGLAPGEAEVVARAEDQEARARVRVKPVPVASLVIAQPDPLDAGSHVQLTVALKDARGNLLMGREVKWTSSSPGVATVTPAGLLTGVTAGTARIAAESEGKSGTVAVTIRPVPVASVAIEGAPRTLQAGESATLRAEARDARGAVLAGRQVAWSVVGDAVSVSPSGQVAARTPGSGTVVATIEGKQGRIELTVLALPAPSVTTEIIPQPVPRSAASGLSGPAPVLEPAPPVARVTGPVALPDTTERAVPVPPAGGRSKAIMALVGVALLAVVGFLLFRPGPAVDLPPAPPPPVNNLSSPVATVTIAGETGAISVGRTRQLAALLQDAGGNELGDRTVVWTSSNPAIAEVSSVGAVTGHRVGTAAITATSEGKSDEFGIVVEEVVDDQPAAVARVAITGGGRPIDPGERLDLSASLKDSRGTSLSDRTVVWSSSDPDVATVSSSGAVTAIGPGETVITASSEGKSSELKVSVNRPKEVVVPPTPVAVASVALSPANPTITAGQTLRLSAQPLDQGGKPLSDRSVAWKSSDEAIARVTTDGTVMAVARGSATITAAAEGKSASTRVTVLEATVPVAAITLVPGARSLRVGESTSWTASARDARGKELADRSVSWSSSAPQVASVNASGVISGVAAGAAEIRATVEGKTASLPITIAAAPVGPPPPPPAGGGNAGANAALAPRRAVEAGTTFACGVNAAGAVCWGAGFEGLTPVGATAGLTGLAMGKAHACGLVSGGRAVCWGDNRFGQLGDGTLTTSVASGTSVSGDLSFSELTSGSAHTCGLAGGKAYCWGRNKDGQVGDGSSSDRKKPTAVKGGKTFIALSAGGKHTCGIASSGVVFCWGDGFSGQLGMGAQESQQEPIDVSGNLKFGKIAAGGQHTCGITTAGKTYCWGANESGQLGDASRSDRTRPQVVDGKLVFEEITAGDNHTCALTSDGTAYCWGGNKTNQLGDGTKANRDHPVAVGGGLTFASISAGEGMTCGLSRAQGPVCWGRNEKGQLGDGGTAAQPSPTPIKP